MTSISGYNLNITKCCGTTYSTPRYRSINLSAWEYWTDGYREGSLFPRDYGLRQCNCGNFYLLNELATIGQVQESDLPNTQRVDAADLTKAIAQARTAKIELAARMLYWQALNQPYRERYRAHRDAEEAGTKAAWDRANPDTRTWWQRFRKAQASEYIRPPNSPFTYPPYELGKEQRENLTAILRLAEGNDSVLGNETLAELYRELGEFERATEAISRVLEKDRGVTSGLIKKLIKQQETAPMRYRI
jgi:hypothetical protein